MKKRAMVGLLCVVMGAGSASAGWYQAYSSGNWSTVNWGRDTGTETEPLPSVTGDVYIDFDKTVSLDYTSTINSLTLGRANGVGILNANTANTLTVNGNATIGLATGNAGALNASAGTVTFGGTTTVNNTGQLNVTGTGTVDLGAVTTTVNGLVDINGGTLSRNTTGVDTTLSGSGLVKLQSGALALAGGTGSDIGRIYTDMEISGGVFTFDNQVGVGNTGNAAQLEVRGDDATINFITLNQQDYLTHGQGTFSFILDDTGVSSIDVDVWMFLDTANVYVDGSAYNVANGTDILLFDAGSLNGTLDTANLTVDGLGAEGVDWEFYQNAGDATVGITIIPEPATLGLIAAFGGGILITRRLFTI